MAAQIVGYILRAKNKQVTARFYEELGLSSREHEHDGPRHYELGPFIKNCVAEVYSWSESFPQDAFMLNVDSISDALEITARYGISPVTELRNGTNMKFIYINDPDGRVVMLIEPK